MRTKILIVDDSTLLHRMYAVALQTYERRAIEAVYASDGAEGLARLHEHPDVALILLDVNMPTMSGLEFLRQVRAMPSFADVRIVLQSTEDAEADVARGLAAGADGYLRKPFNRAELYALLDSLVS